MPPLVKRHPTDYESRGLAAAFKLDGNAHQFSAL
jgi:hypothetical protein